MPRPKDRPAASSFIYFRPPALPAGIVLVHKTPYGNVDIRFRGKGGSVAELRRRYAPRLETGMSIEPAGKSAVIRFDVPQIDIRAPFGEVEPAVRESVWAAKLLLAWFKSTRE